MTQRYPKSYFSCLLYTSDAADDMQCVDLGGRRIIKKKDNLTVFEPKHFLKRCYDGTDAFTLSQTGTLNIKCLKWDLKESPICLDLNWHIFNPQ